MKLNTKNNSVQSNCLYVTGMTYGKVPAFKNLVEVLSNSLSFLVPTAAPQLSSLATTEVLGF